MPRNLSSSGMLCKGSGDLYGEDLGGYVGCVPVLNLQCLSREHPESSKEWRNLDPRLGVGVLTLHGLPGPWGDDSAQFGSANHNDKNCVSTIKQMI